MELLRQLAFAAGMALLVYLCWRLVAPFIAALSWSLALALIVRPAYAWMLRRGVPRNLAAVAMLVLIVLAVIGPAIALAGVLAREAADVVGRFGSEAALRQIRETIEKSPLVGPVFGWLDSRFDLPREALQLARAAAIWASGMVSPVLAGSVWLLTQIAVTLLVLFYLLRDGESILSRLRPLLPFPASELDLFFAKVTRMIRTSLGGKLVVAAIQGALGGLMFGWLGLPAPVFWGAVMAALSIFPVLGAFLVWLPAALAMGFAGDWRHALLLTGWGVLIIHPVDNFLGPVLVGTTLRLHTLLIFFSIVGGLAAFGPAGIVLGPVIVAVAAALVERRSGRVTG